MVELLVGAVLAVIILGSLFAMLRIVFISSRKGTGKLVAIQKIRKPILMIKRDVQQGSSGIRISNTEDGDGIELKIRQLDLDSDGMPQYETGSKDPKEKNITYRFKESTGTLTRNGTKVVSGLENINLFTFGFMHEDITLPALSIEISVRSEKKIVKFRAVAVSRYLIYWARDPNWVDNVTRSLVSYNLPK